MSKDQFEIEWFDFGSEPKCKPNPDYPNGMDLPAPPGATQACKAELPYPFRRCGLCRVTCKACGFVIGITTAGRPDDARSVMVPCHRDGPTH